MLFASSSMFSSVILPLLEPAALVSLLLLFAVAGALALPLLLAAPASFELLPDDAEALVPLPALAWPLPLALTLAAAFAFALPFALALLSPLAGALPLAWLVDWLLLL